MNNIELENKIKELLNIENYFDMIVAMKKFEPEYKKSDFFKETKMPLDIAVKQAKIYYAFQLNDIANKILVNVLKFSFFLPIVMNVAVNDLL